MEEDRMKIGKATALILLSLITVTFLAACGGGGDSAPVVVVPDPIVTTDNATSEFTDNAVLNGTVNPNGLATDAWFEYGTADNNLNLTTTIDNVGSGTSGVAVTATISGLSASTTYYYRIAASNSAGTTRGSILDFTTPANNPPPVADAGPDQSVFMRGPSGANTATLTAAGSTDLYGTITGYLWTQLSGTSVTLDDNTAASPEFTVPQFAYGVSQDLVFQVEVTDDFSTDSTGTYTVVEDPNPNAGAFAYGDGVAVVTTGTGNSIFFSHLFGMGSNGPTGYTAKFSIDYTPTASYNSDGGIVVSLGDDSTTYYRISTLAGENFVEKWRAGSKVADSGAASPGTITQGQTYSIVISFTRSVTTVEAFGQTITLGGGDNPVPMVYFSVSTQEKNASFDNIKLEYLVP
jgi:hypothetical protein